MKEQKLFAEHEEYSIESDAQLIKQEFCTYGLEDKGDKSYICSCCTEEFRPICHECFQNCHLGGKDANKEHLKIAEIKGVYDCSCGKYGHNLIRQGEKQKEKVRCFFSKLFNKQENVQHPGFYKSKEDGKTSCIFCIYSHFDKTSKETVQSVVDKEYTPDPWNSKKTGRMPECQCEKHQERNVIGLIFEFIGAVKNYIYKQTKMSNFNPNILGRLYDDEVYKNKSLSKYLYMFLLKKAEKKRKKKEGESAEEIEMLYNVKFFKTTYEFAYILKTISITLDINRNPNFSFYSSDIIQENWGEVNTYLETEHNDNEADYEENHTLINSANISTHITLNKQTLIREILALKNPTSIQQQEFNLNQFQVYFETKFFFAELIYNLYFRNDLLDHNLCVTNAHAIVSMDVLQRYIYFVKSRKFKNFKQFARSENFEENLKMVLEKEKKGENDEDDDCCSEFINILLEQLGDMLKFKDKIKLDEIKIPFTICNRVMKEFIKFNMVTRQQTQTYFMHVNDALKLDRINVGDSMKKLKKVGENYIIKSVFYSLLYKNDEKLVKSIQGDKKSYEGFCFVTDTDNDLISNVFLSVVTSNKLYLETRTHAMVDANSQKEMKRVFADVKRNKAILKFDYYVQKISELMIGKSSFYEKSIKKLKTQNEHILNAFTQTKTYTEAQGRIVSYLLTPSDQAKSTIFNKTCTIAEQLISLNKDYFHYKINFENYKKSVYQISNKIKELIEETISFVPMKKKYHNVSEKDFGLDKRQNLQVLRESAKFSNIFQALDGFYFIYSEYKQHAGRVQVHAPEEDTIDLDDNRKVLTKDMMLNFLTYLYTIFWSDPQVVPLLSIHNTKNFIISFMECETFFFYFMENMMDAFFGKIVSGLKMDNHNFYAALVTELIELIDFSYFDDTITSQKELDLRLGKLFNHIAKCFKLCIKPLRNLNLNKTRLIDLTQIILNKLEELKSCRVFKEQLSEYQQNLLIPDKNYLTPLYDFGELTSDDKILRKTKYIYIENMLKNYFQLMNDIITTDLKFFNTVEPNKHYLFSVAEMQAFLDKKTSIHLELTMRIFLNKILFNYKLTPKEIVKRRKQETKTHLMNDSKPVYYLKDDVFEFDESGADPDQPLHQKADYLINLMDMKPISSSNKESLSFFETVLKASKQIKSLIKRRILLLTYFESVFVRSTYNLINQMLFRGNGLKGEFTFKMHQLVFNFLKCIFIFYNEILYVDVMEDNIASELSLFETPEFNLYQLENIYMVFPTDNKNDSKLSQGDMTNHNAQNNKKQFISSYLMRDLKMDIHKLKDSIKYFEVDEVIKIFYVHLKKILICDEMTREKEVNREKKLKGRKFIDIFKYLIDKTIDPKKIKKGANICQRVLGDYISASKKCTEKNRSLIKAISISQNEHFDSLGLNFYEYLLTKSLHMLTHANCSFKFVTSYKSAETKLTYNDYFTNIENSLENGDFTLQHTYVFSIFNDLLYHDHMTGQKILYDILTKQLNDYLYEENHLEHVCFFRFIKNVFLFNIFSSVLYECSKVYQIDRISNSNMICFQLSQACIKFLQNLCEGHNNFFQNLFFVLRINFGDNMQQIPMINLVMECMMEVVAHNHFKHDGNLYYKNRIFKDFYTLTVVYERLGDLLIEMIQGCNPSNYQLLFSNEEKETKIVKEHQKRIQNHSYHFLKSLTVPSLHKKRASAFFIEKHITMNNISQGKKPHYHYMNLEKMMTQMKDLLKEGELLFQKETIPYKIKLFQIIVNILTDSYTHTEKKRNTEVDKMLEIFKPEEIIMCVTFYFKVLILEFTNKHALKDQQFEFNIDEAHLVKMKQLYRNFKLKIGFDPFFKIGVYMYMYIIFAADKYENEAALKIRAYGLKIAEQYYSQNLGGNTTTVKTGPFENEQLNSELAEKRKGKVVPIDKNDKKQSEIIDEYKAKSLSAAFFTDLIRKCEFVIRKESESYFNMDELVKIMQLEYQEEENVEFNFQIPPQIKSGAVKNAYFIVDHRCYAVEEEHIVKFLKTVEMTTPSVKLKTFLDKIDVFQAEAHFRQKQSEEPSEEEKKVSWVFFDSDSSLNKFNFLVSVFINLIIFFQFSNESFFNTYYYTFILLLCLMLIYSNVSFLVNFLMKKYKFILKMELTRQGIKKSQLRKMSWKEWLKIQVVNTVLTQENYLLLINIFIPFTCVLFKYAVILFPLQLFTVVKFVDTINDVVRAFTYKIDELLSMVGFLGILILFYANLGFFFMPQEFEMDISNGEHINACGTLLDCIVTYFNFGVRSGGGIGDVIGPQAYADTYWYVLRFTFDMVFYITVILLIMNMINGIIISTFGALREEQENKQEEMESKCFICSISKAHFEKYKVDFELHKIKEHHIGNYIKYFIILLLTDDRELNSDETYIKKSLRNKDIGFFPVLKAKSLIDIDGYKYDKGEEEDE